MKLFHRTWAVNAAEILLGGFADGSKGYVWLSSIPLDPDQMKGGQGGDVVVVVELPDDVVRPHPRLSRDGYIAYKIPAEVLNMGKAAFSGSDYAGLSRNEVLGLLHEAEAMEAKGNCKGPVGSKWAKAATYAEAIAFLDRFAPLP